MKAQAYVDKRKLEMVKESQDLEKQREGIQAEAQKLQARATQVNQKIFRIEVELDVLTNLEGNLKEGEK